jgi:hypothetical protein
MPPRPSSRHAISPCSGTPSGATRPGAVVRRRSLLRAAAAIAELDAVIWELTSDGAPLVRWSASSPLVRAADQQTAWTRYEAVLNRAFERSHCGPCACTTPGLSTRRSSGTPTAPTRPSGRPTAASPTQLHRPGGPAPPDRGTDLDPGGRAHPAGDDRPRAGQLAVPGGHGGGERRVPRRPSLGFPRRRHRGGCQRPPARGHHGPACPVGRGDSAPGAWASGAWPLGRQAAHRHPRHPLRPAGSPPPAVRAATAGSPDPSREEVPGTSPPTSARPARSPSEQRLGGA